MDNLTNNMNKADLKICFLLKVEDNFYTEFEIWQKLANLRKLAEAGKVDFYTTDGALSIQYLDEELLGIGLWNEMVPTIENILALFNNLISGETISEFLQLQSCWIRLTRKGKTQLLYELESTTSRRSISLKRLLPFEEFIREFFLMYYRTVRILSALGSESFTKVEIEWQEHLSPKVITIVGMENLTRLMTSPLNEILICRPQNVATLFLYDNSDRTK